ncbi:MAG: 50S ribosomal protein L31 [Oligoflexia bacterium]|nr:50S ribosomal protein L31 [Oligoflexia bacterium]
MKKDIHPEYFESKIHCGGCGTTMEIGSTSPEMRLNVCSKCHPFYSGQTKIMDTEGRVDRFNKKYAKFQTAAK